MVLHRALGAAVRQGRVNRNVASLATPPRMAHVEMRVLDPAEVRHLRAVAAEEADHGALLILAVTTGMRQGELLALRWRDVDLERGTLAVTGTLQRVNGEGLVRGEPKTARSRRRKTPAHADRSSRSPPPAGDPSRYPAHGRRSWTPGDWVFTGPFGAPRDANAVRAAWHRLCRRAGLPPIRFHDHADVGITTISATRPRPSCWVKGSIRRSLPTCWGTRRWRSPWIGILMWPWRCTRERPTPSRQSCGSLGLHGLDQRLPTQGSAVEVRDLKSPHGGMTEWLMVAVLKTAEAATFPRVRIPLPPPFLISKWAPAGLLGLAFAGRLGALLVPMDPKGTGTDRIDGPSWGAPCRGKGSRPASI